MLFFAFFALLSACARPEEGGRERGFIRVSVREGFTDRPIAGACVNIPEADARFFTDENGLTELIPVPVIPDPEYEKLLPSGVGRATLLVTAEGMTPYLLLCARITPNAERTVGILLFPADGTLPVFTVIEAPGEEWCESFAEKFGAGK